MWNDLARLSQKEDQIPVKKALLSIDNKAFFANQHY